MDKKRLVIDLEEVAHAMLMEEARQRNLTLSNYVRHALHLPLERQGVRLDSMQIVRPSIEDVPEFYVIQIQGRASFQVWIPGPGGFPYQVTPTPPLAKGAYASPESVRTGQLQMAENDLYGNHPLLLLSIPHSSGTPFRAVRLFSQGAPSYTPPPNAVTYLATTSRVRYSWMSDLSQGKRGFFLTGLPNASDLWEIISCESDPSDRCVFMLSPVRLPHGLPTPDFSKMTEPTLRAEAEQHWKNLEQAVVAHNPYALVNSAASLSEALLRQFLTAPGAPRENLGAMLDKLRLELENSTSAFSLVSYHFMQAVRVMHQSTQHPGRVVATGRPIRPGLALAIAEGMVEVLASVGMIQ